MVLALISGQAIGKHPLLESASDLLRWIVIAELVPPYSWPACERSPALSTAESAVRTPLLTFRLVGWVPEP